MGVRIVAKGVSAEDYASEYAAPVRRGLEGIFFTNGSLEKLARNYAPGKPQASLVGSPTPLTNWATLKGQTNFIQTQIDETVEMTLFAIGRATVVTGDPQQVPMLVGTYSTSNVTGNGVSIYSGVGDRWQGTAGIGTSEADNANVSSSVSPLVTASWNCISVIITATQIRTRCHNLGLSNQQTLALPRRLGGRKLRLGSGYSTGIQGNCDLVVSQIHSIAMTDAERDATAADLMAYAQRRGIVF